MASVKARSTLWVGDLNTSLDEDGLMEMFQDLEKVVSCKVVRDQFTRLSAGYGFVEFTSPAVAAHILETYNGKPISGSSDGKTYKLNWSQQGASILSTSASTTFGRPTPLPTIGAPSFSIFVGDIESSITEAQLLAKFKERYRSVDHANIVTDPNGIPRGYGFVRFLDAVEGKRAIQEMNGVLLGVRPIRVSSASSKHSKSSYLGSSYYQFSQPIVQQLHQAARTVGPVSEPVAVPLHVQPPTQFTCTPDQAYCQLSTKMHLYPFESL